eukprot:Rhum_TRINITY_DN10314_c0_g1::Rhum_TRINITY_DN10314_c0_g1_i1::g.37900::m.37900
MLFDDGASVCETASTSLPPFYGADRCDDLSDFFSPVSASRRSGGGKSERPSPHRSSRVHRSKAGLSFVVDGTVHPVSTPAASASPVPRQPPARVQQEQQQPPPPLATGSKLYRVLLGGVKVTGLYLPQNPSGDSRVLAEVERQNELWEYFARYEGGGSAGESEAFHGVTAVSQLSVHKNECCVVFDEWVNLRAGSGGAEVSDLYVDIVRRRRNSGGGGAESVVGRGVVSLSDATTTGVKSSVRLNSQNWILFCIVQEQWLAGCVQPASPASPAPPPLATSLLLPDSGGPPTPLPPPPPPIPSDLLAHPARYSSYGLGTDCGTSLPPTPAPPFSSPAYIGNERLLPPPLVAAPPAADAVAASCGDGAAVETYFKGPKADNGMPQHAVELAARRGRLKVDGLRVWVEAASEEREGVEVVQAVPAADVAEVSAVQTPDGLLFYVMVVARRGHSLLCAAAHDAAALEFLEACSGLGLDVACATTADTSAPDLRALFEALVARAAQAEYPTDGVAIGVGSRALSPSSPLSPGAAAAAARKQDLAARSRAEAVHKAVKGLRTDEGAVFRVVGGVRGREEWEAVCAAFRRAHPSFAGGDIAKALAENLSRKALETCRTDLARKGVSLGASGGGGGSNGASAALPAHEAATPDTAHAAALAVVPAATPHRGRVRGAENPDSALGSHQAALLYTALVGPSVDAAAVFSVLKGVGSQAAWDDLVRQYKASFPLAHAGDLSVALKARLSTVDLERCAAILERRGVVGSPRRRTPAAAAASKRQTPDFQTARRHAAALFRSIEGLDADDGGDALFEVMAQQRSQKDWEEVAVQFELMHPACCGGDLLAALQSGLSKRELAKCKQILAKKVVELNPRAAPQGRAPAILRKPSGSASVSSALVGR